MGFIKKLFGGKNNDHQNVTTTKDNFGGGIKCDNWDFNITKNILYNYRGKSNRVTIPESIKRIGEKAFYYNSLTSVTIPNSVESIGEEAFSYCESLASVIIPDSVKVIESGAFKGCKSLASVTIANSVKSIGSSAFDSCKSLTSVKIPNSVESIGSSAFSYCESLTSVTIPNSVKIIDSFAFCFCNSLTSVTIPNSVESIGRHAFSQCESLTSVIMPDFVESMGHSVFDGCKSLTSPINCAATPKREEKHCIIIGLNCEVDRKDIIKIKREGYIPLEIFTSSVLAIKVPNLQMTAQEAYTYFMLYAQAEGWKDASLNANELTMSDKRKLWLVYEK